MMRLPDNIKDAKGSTMPPRDLPLNPWFKLAEKYGLGTLLLVTLMYWARPHVDRVINDHCEFMRTVSDVSQKQTQLIDQGTKTMDRIEQRTERTHEMIRDIHGRIVNGPVDADVAQPPPPVASN